MSERSFTGQPRRRVTRRGVRVAERMARLFISIGGLGTIAAVTLILVFLVWVVTPLFLGASLDGGSNATLATEAGEEEPLCVGLDEHGKLGWALFGDGVVSAWRASDGEVLERRSLFAPGILSAASLSISGDEITLGFSDGTLRTGTIRCASDEASNPQSAPDSPKLAIRLSDPIDTGSQSRIVRVDRSQSGARELLCALDAAGRLVFIEVERRENLLTGEVTTTSNQHVLPYAPLRDAPAPEHLLVSGNGSSVFLAWRNGLLQRYDARDPEQARLAETTSLLGDGGELTSLCFLLGKNTLISGDSRGRIRAWFCTKGSDARTIDGATLVLAHEIAQGGAPIVALAPSARSRVIAVGSARGDVGLYHVTSHKLLAQNHLRAAPEASGAVPGDARTSHVQDSTTDQRVVALAFAPKEDGLVALGENGITRWSVDLGHPEASLAALFAPVWYEGYEKPEHTWQSTSGTDDFEPKLGLMPLVFGTLKATLYSMLFGLPIALLAAVYTSEFLKPKLRAPLKSLTEMMASLPSVVLGFLAAIVIAPFAQTYVPAILTAFVTIPGTLLLGAHLWQLVPQRIAVRWSGAPRFALIALALPCGAAAAFALGPIVERAFFAGNLLAWLDRQGGRALGGWVILVLPISILIVVLLASRILDPWVRRVSASWTRGRCARFDLGKFIVGALMALGIAFGIAFVLDGLWLDPRGSVLDTYVQRNALVVGFVMGFAVIPIVYTLAEDALSSVPQHLRLASLGAGATQWQTAVRVVIPTAMSGLFSAAMIGLGRAVGETMIVLMATGNTPVMSWNVFNGFRTLSANLATELPEAVQNSTHYRTLFLAALCLFALTFVFNTLAEVVRQRFRKRAYQL